MSSKVVNHLNLSEIEEVETGIPIDDVTKKEIIEEVEQL